MAPAYIHATVLPFVLIWARFVVGKSVLYYFTQYKSNFVHIVRINNVPKQCVCVLYTYNLNREETGVGSDSRQVPGYCLGYG